ncbi:hypothetical protein pdul_cds_91 [Pandoravirus dulcis]|uniref:Uncharacterized protein n=1 Tax=Pandoravirus dulcis TaxID=1349409 RepID=S4VRJ3_9VIRU|nr:hypothetical protein pdul_cds_91 [Pandoravirus dulcis]AGO81990.2 hypothetical protein pdul_cds_91 [Pandoravirus dulcis]
MSRQRMLGGRFPLVIFFLLADPLDRNPIARFTVWIHKTSFFRSSTAVPGEWGLSKCCLAFAVSRSLAAHKCMRDPIEKKIGA